MSEHIVNDAGEVTGTVIRCRDCKRALPHKAGLVCMENTVFPRATDPDGWCWRAEVRDDGR